MGFHVTEHGQYKPDDATCKSCGMVDRINCHPGQFPKCWNCNSILVYLGKPPDAECVTPTGMIDKHRSMVNMKDGVMMCHFCGKP